MRKEAFFNQTNQFNCHPRACGDFRQIGHTLIEVILAISITSILLLLMTEVFTVSSSWLTKLTHKVNHMHNVSAAIVLLQKAYHASKNPVLLNKADSNMKITRRGQGQYISGQILKSNGVWYIGKNSHKQKELYRFKDRYRRKMIRLDAFDFNLTSHILRVSLDGQVYSTQV